MLVYRIEDAKGDGPWHVGAVFDYDDAHRCRRAHSAYDPPGPCSYEELGTDLHNTFRNRASDANEFFFGFRSKAQLRRWFRSAVGRRAMKKHGLSLAVFDVDPAHVAQGNWQLAFRRALATRVSTLDLVTLN
jgi:hypothetical protein